MRCTGNGISFKVDECVIRDVWLAGVKWLVIAHVISIRGIDTIGLNTKSQLKRSCPGIMWRLDDNGERFWAEMRFIVHLQIKLIKIEVYENYLCAESVIRSGI